MLVEQIGGTLVTIAKDVKIQVEFNPAQVAALPADRLREPHAGGTRTSTTTRRTPARSAPGTRSPRSTRSCRWACDRRCPASTRCGTSSRASRARARTTGELLNVKLRYKPPGGFVSKLAEHPVVDDGADVAAASSDLRFAAAVAAFGMILRDSPYRGDASVDMVRALAEEALGTDAHGHRRGFVQLVQRAAGIPR